ncbi:MAG: C-terminal helicase domain-containing protein, partial [Polyangiales bacterium]
VMLRQATGVAKAAFVADFVRLLVESGEKVVLFGWHREVYSLWMDRLRDLSPSLYTGTESPTQKDDARKRFLAGETPILIMSLRSGAGLDGLQEVCRTCVFGELDWSPGVHEQCVGRVYRDGQREPVVSYFLISEHGSDPAIADVLQIKRAQVDGMRDPMGALVEAVEPLDGGEERVRRLATDYLRQRGHELGALSPSV